MNLLEDFDTALPQNHKKDLSEQEILHELIGILDMYFNKPFLLNERYVELYILSFLKYLHRLPDWRFTYNDIMTHYANGYQKDIFGTYLNKNIKIILKAL